MTKIKFILKFKNILAITAILFFISDSNSQPLFVENFNFPVRDTLYDIGGWYSSGSNNKKVRVISPGLIYVGYTGTGIGNTACFTNQPDGDLSLNSFTEQNSGTVYMSFLIRVDSLSSSATEGYNISFDEAGGSTNINTKIYIKKINSSSFNFGIMKYVGTVKYSPVTYSKNTTYLVICSYTFVSGSNNDIARLYVNTSGVPATQPASSSAADTSGQDVNNLGDVILSNAFIQTGLQGSSVKIDGIRIGTTWASTLFQPFNVQLNLKSLIQGFYNSSTGKMVKDTARVILRYNKAPYTIADSSKAILDSNGNGIFIFTKIGNRAPYFITVKHRNTVETWSWDAVEFENNTCSFDFTYAATQAFGNNQIHLGTKYCLYNGDVNQNGSIDLTDIVAVNNNSANFITGYKATDLTGNNVTDLTDLILTYNNSSNFISVKKP